MPVASLFATPAVMLAARQPVTLVLMPAVGEVVILVVMLAARLPVIPGATRVRRVKQVVIPGAMPLRRVKQVVKVVVTLYATLREIPVARRVRLRVMARVKLRVMPGVRLGVLAGGVKLRVMECVKPRVFERVTRVRRRSIWVTGV
jgi:hypothetical protein